MRLLVIGMSFLVISLLNPSPSSASPARTSADLTCTGSSGLSYNIYYRRFTEIIIYRNNEPIDYLDSMRAIFRGKMLYYIHEEGDFVAAFRLKENHAVGRVRKDRVYCQLHPAQ